MSQGLPVPPPFPTPPPGFNRHYQTSAQQLPEETELQRRKRQALERMSARPPPVAAAESVQRRSGPDSGYGPAPDPNDKEAFEAYRRACWLKYYQHMAALQTPEESDDHHNHQQQQQKQSSTVTPMPHDDDDDEDDDINKELLGL
ncbi:hypothetical protein Pmar_PMAR013664 [Perkinsus marinus ATCC 50983]|uniref:Uncharacterized protein n=1 Tax=Perkinsus marinus (strain ATCC 50983 / TXsc) TaxID=423536 RepID=C5LXY7_PERM5|nr:hypothetical protein Pmar_PMAR013664 [Perkinsus marinus ATCC 50983]EEQ98317.1 hypothetical protein Pmar_PMAR013664 [Perkinsus marinus ATCC 50983]|eukprot:XP_002765600.1 hypothetical protein Pmar_PMAR013664 [Perkinsus marinus ATCC 50983]